MGLLDTNNYSTNISKYTLNTQFEIEKLTFDHPMIMCENT